MPPPTVLWPLESHTLGKHVVLREYLNAWLPILGMTQGRIAVVDGFAGPGAYAGGEPGSPVIALDALIGHAALRRFRAEVVFAFIEADAARATHLESLVAPRRARLPAGSSALVEHGAFATTLNRLLDEIEGTGRQLAPTFLMVDPFGVSDTPLSVIARALKHPRSEVYVSFMYEAINRFRGSPEFTRHLDGLFGTEAWRDGIDIADPGARKAFFYDLYEAQLRATGARHVVRFELYNGNRLVYAIFHATQHALGCDRMKQAIWKAAPGGDYAFRGSRSGQTALALDGADLAPFGAELLALLERLGDGLGEDAWTPVEVLAAYAQSGETLYHSGHLKAALRALEAAGHIDVDPTSRRKRNTFPDGTRLRRPVPSRPGVP